MLRSTCIGLAAACLAGPALADVIIDTGPPNGGMMGYYGFDLLTTQSVAVAFTPGQDYRLDGIGMWIMSNDFDNAGRQYTVTLRTDAEGGMTIPGGTIIESWTVATDAIGWSPVLDSLVSALNPVLSAGQTYWIVAESAEPPGGNPVWVAGAQDEPVWHSVQNAMNPNGEWISGWGNGVPAMVVSGTVVPAPGALACLAFGLTAGARRRR